MVVDAYFSKETFITPMMKAEFHIVSRLRKDAHLKYLYNGKRKKGRGRPKKYDGKIDVNNLINPQALCVANADKERIYHVKAHAVALKRTINLVIVYTLDKNKKWQHRLFFSTDLTQSWQEILELYKLRFQIEFLYRDAKQHTGLNDCQARSKNKLNFHWNMSLTAINLAKIKYWLPKKKGNPALKIPFSMSDIKTKYNNKLMINRFISVFGINTKRTINKFRITKCLDFGRRVA